MKAALLLLGAGGLATQALAKTVKASDVVVKTRACQPGQDTYGFCDTSKSIADRVADLIGRLQDEDIAPQLTARHQGGGNPGPKSNISRLGIPDHDWGLNCIHGVQTSCVELADGTVKCPTSFMNPINYGQSWNDSLFFDLGAIIATETRALWLQGAQEYDPWTGNPVIGPSCWSPNINQPRDPRWGRFMETAGESSVINGAFGSGYTRGLQTGADPRYINVAVTLKHWDAYSLEDSDGFTRHNFNAQVSNYSLATTFFPAFKRSVVEGGAVGVMCSYNAVNGVPTCASPFLRRVLRESWGMQGYVTSDTGAVEDIWSSGGHKYAPDGDKGACAAVRDGQTDVCSGTTYHDHLLAGVANGDCARADVDLALQHVFELRMRLGLFDPIENAPYWQVPPSQINTQAAQDNMWLGTLSSMVLLKNDGNTLPLRAGIKLAVIGPHANATSALVGNYLGQLCPMPAGKPDTMDCIVSPSAALAAANVGGSTASAAGCPLTKNDTSGFAAATALAAASDAVVLMLGIDTTVEGESNDRKSIDLPYIQHQLAAAVAAAAAGKPVVIVLLNGGSVDVTAERDSKAIGAMVAAGYPGVRGADAIAATVFGTNDHLGGKLSQTYYPASYVSQIAMSEMEMDVGPGRGYRYYNGTTVFPFGWGLSLTTFDLATESAPTPAQSVLPVETPGVPGANLSYVVTITNTGTRTGDEVVQVYFWPQSTPSQPASRLIKELVAYRRVHLAPGAAATLPFSIGASSLRMADKATGNIVSTPGSYLLQITNGAGNSLTYPITLTGTETVVEPFPIY